MIIRIRKGKAKLKPTVSKERINREIKVDKIRLIDEAGEQVGVVSLSEGITKAKAVNLDLVEVSPKANPPVCKILDFGKYHYQKERSLRESRKKQHIVLTKEIKFGPLTDEHDYKFKLKNAIKFLQAKDKVRFTVRFKGRQLANKQLGFDLLEKIKQDMMDYAKVDQAPSNEGRVVYMVMSPNTKSNL